MSRRRARSSSSMSPYVWLVARPGDRLRVTKSTLPTFARRGDLCTVARERRTFSLRDLSCALATVWRVHSTILAQRECQTFSRSAGHKSRRRSPTSARDASRQSRVGCRVVSECHRHAIRLRRAGDAYRVDGSLHVDRRAERCSATACAAHVCRRSWRARQQLWVS